MVDTVGRHWVDLTKSDCNATNLPPREDGKEVGGHVPFAPRVSAWASACRNASLASSPTLKKKKEERTKLRIWALSRRVPAVSHGGVWAWDDAWTIICVVDDSDLPQTLRYEIEYPPETSGSIRSATISKSLGKSARGGSALSKWIWSVVNSRSRHSRMRGWPRVTSSGVHMTIKYVLPSTGR